MRRDEAYVILTTIASDEIVASYVSQRLFNIRDTMVCEVGEKEALYNTFAYLNSLAENSILSRHFHEGLITMANEIYADTLEECDVSICSKRCKNCKHYKGGR